MRILFAAVLICGLGLAGFAVFMAKDYVASLEAQSGTTPAIPMTEVIAVSRDIEYGERLTPDDLAYISLPTEILPVGTFTESDVLFPRGFDVPRTVLRAMSANEPVLASKVTNAGEDAGVATRLSDGKRAFAISVDVTSGVSGFIRPDDRVDIFWTGNLPDGRANVTKLIDTNVRIIAVDQSADAERAEAAVARTVTVEASSHQVASLAQAQSSGRLSLALVGALDETVSAAVEIDQRQLLGIKAEVPKAEPAAPESCVIRTRRGSEVVEIAIPCTN